MVHRRFPGSVRMHTGKRSVFTRVANARLYCTRASTLFCKPRVHCVFFNVVLYQSARGMTWLKLPGKAVLGRPRYLHDTISHTEARRLIHRTRQTFFSRYYVQFTLKFE